MGAGIPYLTESILQGVDKNPKAKRVVVMSPAIVVEKWAREIEERVPNAKTYIVKSWLDIKALYDKTSYVDDKGKIKFKDPEVFEYYIISSSLPSQSYPLELDIIEHFEEETPNVRLENKYPYAKEDYVLDASGKSKPTVSSKGSFKCPSCGARAGVYRENKKEGTINFFAYDLKSFYNQNKDNFTFKRLSRNSKCNQLINKNGKQVKCGYSFWQPEKNMSQGRRKVSPVWYINKMFPRGFFKYLILDEAHEFKGGSSKIGQSLGQLINHTEKQILLTGTLMGGMSEDIYWLLAKLNPKRLLAEGIKYGQVSKFNDKYGVNSIREISRDNGLTYRASGSKSEPGINPHLFPAYLMENATFLELNDMGYALPRYEEVPVVVEMSDRLSSSYNRFFRDFVGTIAEVDGPNKFGFSLINSLYQYADFPSRMNEIPLYSDGYEVGIVPAPDHYVIDNYAGELDDDTVSIDNDALAKYNTLLDIVKDQLYNEDRKSLIYATYTGETSHIASDKWLYHKLKEEGLNVGILTSGSSYDGIRMPKNSTEREEWLSKMMDKHDWDVLITNPELVKVGLDLLDFPNIHFYQMSYSTYNYMQASRRSWRIRQTKPVKVYTYVYKDTVQEMILYHMAKKIDASLAIQGKLSEEGLRTMADTGGINQLAKDLINNNVIQTESVASTFERKNQTFEAMQSVEFQEYEFYVMNPIEGGIEGVREARDRILKEDIKSVDRSIKAVKVNVKVKESEGKREIVDVVHKPISVIPKNDFLDNLVVLIEDKDQKKDANKGVKKKDKVVEGQLILSF